MKHNSVFDDDCISWETMPDQTIAADEITISQEALSAAIVEEVQDYFSGTDWQYSLESGAPLIARFAISRVLRQQSGKRSPGAY